VEHLDITSSTVYDHQPRDELICVRTDLGLQVPEHAAETFNLWVSRPVIITITRSDSDSRSSTALSASVSTVLTPPMWEHNYRELVESLTSIHSCMQTPKLVYRHRIRRSDPGLDFFWQFL